MQKQAYLTQQIWMETSTISNTEDKQTILDLIGGIWKSNYSISIITMKDSINNLENISNTGYILDKICEIALEICKSRIITVNITGKDCKNLQFEYKTGENLIKKDEHNLGFEHLKKVFTDYEYLIKGQIIQSQNELEKNSNLENILYFLVMILILLVIFLFLKLKSS
jgi:hypothetical protein